MNTYDEPIIIALTSVTILVTNLQKYSPKILQLQPGATLFGCRQQFSLFFKNRQKNG